MKYHRMLWLPFSIIGFLFIFCGSMFEYGNAQPDHISTQLQEIECDKLGWFPDEFGLKDHSIFLYDGNYYLISIYVPLETDNPFAQDRFVYARSTDLCNWERLDDVLSTRIPGSWDEKAIWAPYVYEENGIYYLFYTGVNNNKTQRILLATSSDPSNPLSWQKKEGWEFHPNHDDMVWLEDDWADCRDPMVIKKGNTYYLYYTGKDETGGIGGIIGYATTTAILDVWKDHGRVVIPDDRAFLESPFLLYNEELYYLFYNLAGVGEYYRSSESYLGPWSDEKAFLPGWAHEFFLGKEGKLYSSYLTEPTVTISPVSWDRLVIPPRPVLSDKIFRQFFPQILGQ